MNFEVKWAGRHKHNNGRIWGYLVNHEAENWLEPYPSYSFWGKKDGTIYFQKIRENRSRNNFQNTIRHKKEKYILDLPLLENQIKIQFEQREIIRKLSGG